MVTTTVTCFSWAPSSGDHLLTCGAIFWPPLISDPVEFFENLVQPESGSELQNPIGLRSGNWIMFNTGEHGQDQDWISWKMLAIFLDQDWIWIFIFEKIWIRTGSGYFFDFYNKIFLRVIQDVTNDGAGVFFDMIFIFTKNQNDFVSMCCTHHSRW